MLPSFCLLARPSRFFLFAAEQQAQQALSLDEQR